MSDRAILAVDPGLRTGLAFHRWTDGDIQSPNSARDAASGAAGLWFTEEDFEGTCNRVLTAVTAFGSDLLLLSESFIITVNTAKNTQAPWSLELIGFMRWASRRYTGRDLTLQTPSQAKRFTSDARLKLMGYWTVGMKGHANDAARHLLLAEATRGYLGSDKLKELALAP
jgi:hypothetical protein